MNYKKKVNIQLYEAWRHHVYQLYMNIEMSKREAIKMIGTLGHLSPVQR